MKRPCQPLISAGVLGALALGSVPVEAGEFDAVGTLHRDPAAIAFVGFEGTVERYVPSSEDEACQTPMYELVSDGTSVEGQGHISVDALEGCSERFTVTLPPVDGSYRATVWMRHGAVDAQLTVAYAADSGRETVRAKMFPTGRYTSDGWVELASNEFPVDGALVDVAYLLVGDYAHRQGLDLDALEIVRQGDHLSVRPCTGVGDPVCTEEESCIYQRCRLERLSVPPLPPEPFRDDVVDQMQSHLRVFFGGRKTRLEDLPAALDILESIRSAETAWQFWGGWARAIRRLHDAHTSAWRGSSYSSSQTRRINACFIEGDGDASAHIWPRHPKYKDLLVSHAGTEDTHGFDQGDRLVAVDGLHPIEWALTQLPNRWSWSQATDSDVYSEIAQSMRSLVIEFASQVTVIDCDSAQGTCDPIPRTVVIGELPEGTGGNVRCDNRPFYHFDEANNPGPNHNTGWQFFRGAIVGTTPEEAIFGMVWDTLYGGGDPSGHVNSNINAAIDDWKVNARGVILDHRTGNGGTLDAVNNLTRLVRPPETIAIDMSPLSWAGFDGPETPADGIALFQQYRSRFDWTVGDDDHDPLLPVALLVHRDVSASDYLPHAMKGSPKVRLFGPHGTAGAFSTYLSLRYWSGLGFNFASGEPITSDGRALIGHGVVPDVAVDQKQSDLLAGVDTIHEAALAWVRQELKP
ncbi:MAG: hypothetical protein JRI23_31885 [Deltaproteobacteria bacterium]|jgi:hypothetical protein|nr:hypothetical protein [Deltaproteobacteria bacterium]MBW2536825.1 hypothetical protein [Deltaproteobacteria bacterium]